MKAETQGAAYDFTKLTEAQQWILTLGGWSFGSGHAQPGKSTVKKLIERGLVVERTARDSSKWPTITFTEYDVPTPVHMAWCERCSKLEQRKEKKQ